MHTQLRPPAVPLVTIDPYFNAWSMSNHLHDDFTRHWTGTKNPMTGIALIDNISYQFAGRIEQNICLDFQKPAEMLQTDLQLGPLSSTYTFTGGGVQLKAAFTTPLLLNDLELMSRPASYVSFTVQSLDDNSHSIKLYFDITAEWCVHDTKQKVICGRKDLGDGITSMFIGTKEQNILGRSGDDVRIDWGYVNLVTNNTFPTVTIIGRKGIRKEFIDSGEIKSEDFDETAPIVMDECPVLSCTTHFENVRNNPLSAFLVLAYDDIYSIEYFGKQLPAYWRRNGQTFDEMLVRSIKDYTAVISKCNKLDNELIRNGIAAGGEQYSELLSLSYRQAIAAHKLVEDDEGKILFFSKENFSNGCIATVDVSYPSTPLFLLFNPELVKGMMRPIFKYAGTEQWKFEFAPHDAGCYPKANGQVYGLENGELLVKYQMPIEECGNMLIMTAAVCYQEKDAAFAAEHWELLTKWAGYLKNNGLDPENQLCTDDFAGHLAHNTNLSIKAIVAIGAYAQLCCMLGKDNAAAEYMQKAKSMAQEWPVKANDGDHYRLAFDKPGTWSMKYNLIWDDLLGLHLFAPEIKKKEVQYYLKMQNYYGLPLDNRNTYTKSDWLVWVASMSDSKEAFEKLIEPLWTAMHESPSRVPFTDWYDTVSSKQIGFQNRSVVGGIFIKLLKKG